MTIMGKPHMPTLYSVTIVVVVLFVLYHLAGKAKHRG